MTLFLPLDPTTPPPQSPPFLSPATDRNAGMARVVQALLKAKRIVVICGAGISVQAGIPDFRSADGLFRTLKRDNPRESLSSGKDLFDASVFNSEHTTSLFCQMMAQLSDMSQNAEPTSFHQLLRALDDRGRLLRVYTQNIDAIEQKCGLSFGVPDLESRRSRGRGKRKATTRSDEETTDQSMDGQPEASTSRLATPIPETPRCIPLHGTLQSMYCQICSNSFPLPDYLPSLNAGLPPQCPECENIERTRVLIGKRPRAIGKLRPSVVLYNEAHNNGEGVGDVVQKDLIGSSKGKGRSGADFLLVVGTSLRIPGTKRMVREFAKAVKSRGTGSTPSGKEEAAGGSGSTTPNDSSRRSPTIDEDPPPPAAPPPPKAVYLNLDFPVPTREWEGVFDAWVQGDAQVFADTLRDEIKKEAKAKQLASERKRRREEEAAAATAAKGPGEEEDIDVEMLPPPPLPTPQSTPRKRNTTASATPSKRQKKGGKGHQAAVCEPEAEERLTIRLPASTPGNKPGSPHLPPPRTPPRRSSSSYSQEFRGYPSLPTPGSSPPSQTRWQHPSRTTPPHLSPYSFDPELSWSSRGSYRPSISSFNILTSSIRSTLEDHERDCFPSSNLVEVGHYGFTG